ncbi:hypothetical protein BJ742DRAFT_420572 [Cladochytrium replicatum]|nr:hypothetical protein BJ742DRAFT_420572 [Cladochytrium replicatum]
MFLPQLDSALGWIDTAAGKTERRDARHLVLVTDTLYADAAFLVHHFISRCLRIDTPPSSSGTSFRPVSRKDVTAKASKKILSENSWSVLVVATSRTISAIDVIQRRMGSNLNQLRDAGSFSELDLFEQNDAGWIDIESRIDDLSLKISEHAEKRKNGDSTNGRLCIIVDDLSAMLFSGASVSALLRFVIHSKRMVDQSDGLLVLRLHTDDTSTADLELIALSQMLKHMSDVHLETLELKTGSTQDVHGEVSVKTGSKVAGPGPVHQTFHYRIQDTKVHFFPRGYADVRQ